MLLLLALGGLPAALGSSVCAPVLMELNTICSEDNARYLGTYSNVMECAENIATSCQYNNEWLNWNPRRGYCNCSKQPGDCSTDPAFLNGVNLYHIPDDCDSQDVPDTWDESTCPYNKKGLITQADIEAADCDEMGTGVGHICATGKECGQNHEAGIFETNIAWKGRADKDVRAECVQAAICTNTGASASSKFKWVNMAQKAPAGCSYSPSDDTLYFNRAKGSSGYGTANARTSLMSICAARKSQEEKSADPFFELHDFPPLDATYAMKTMAEGDCQAQGFGWYDVKADDVDTAVLECITAVASLTTRTGQKRVKVVRKAGAPYGCIIYVNPGHANHQRAFYNTIDGHDNDDYNRVCRYDMGLRANVNKDDPTYTMLDKARKNRSRFW